MSDGWPAPREDFHPTPEEEMAEYRQQDEERRRRFVAETERDKKQRYGLSPVEEFLGALLLFWLAVTVAMIAEGVWHALS